MLSSVAFLPHMAVQLLTCTLEVLGLMFTNKRTWVCRKKKNSNHKGTRSGRVSCSSHTLILQHNLRGPGALQMFVHLLLKGSLLSLWLPLPPCLSHSVFFHTQPSFRYQPWTQETTESDAWGQFSKMRSCTQFAVLPPKFQSLIEGSKNLVSCSPPGRGLCHEECYHDGKQSQSPAPKEHVDKPEKLKVTF